MNEKSMTASSQPRPSMRALPDDERVSQPGLELCLREPLGIRAQVEEAERVLGVQIGGLFDEGALVDE